MASDYAGMDDDAACFLTVNQTVNPTQLKRMKKINTIIITVIALVLSIGALSAQSATPDQQIETLRAANAAAVANKTGAQNVAAINQWLNDNKSAIEALVSSLDAVRADNAAWLASRYGMALNGGAATSTWTMGLDIVKAYAPRYYYARAATEAELDAYAASGNAEVWASYLGYRRLGKLAKAEAVLAGAKGTGCILKEYQDYFRRAVKGETLAEAKGLIDAEIRCVVALSQSTARDKWLAELRTMQVLYKDID